MPRARRVGRDRRAVRLGHPWQRAVPTATYAYQPAPGAMVEKTRHIASVCERHRVPLGAAALQFPLAHPAVVSVIPGPSSAEQVRANLKWIAQPIPAVFWDELKERGLLRKDAPVPLAV